LKLTQINHINYHFLLLHQIHVKILILNNIIQIFIKISYFKIKQKVLEIIQINNNGKKIILLQLLHQFHKNLEKLP
jgi:hypothetical protein